MESCVTQVTFSKELCDEFIQYVEILRLTLLEANRAIIEHHSHKLLSDEYNSCPWCNSKEGKRVLKRIDMGLL